MDQSEIENSNKLSPRCAPCNPPFSYGLRTIEVWEVPHLRIGPSMEEVSGDSMEVDLRSVGLSEDAKAERWAIVPFKSDLNDNLIEEAIKEFRARKDACKKKTKKHKKDKGPVEASSGY